MTTVTRIWPPARGGGGGTVIQYTTFASPWTADEPWQLHLFQQDLELGANANFFAPDPPSTAISF